VTPPTELMIRAAQAATKCDPAECDECIAAAITAALAAVEATEQLAADFLQAFDQACEQHPGEPQIEYVRLALQTLLTGGPR
jgi:hypothetical protein